VPGLAGDLGDYLWILFQKVYIQQRGMECRSMQYSTGMKIPSGHIVDI
jgi:hypothetical protein